MVCKISIPTYNTDTKISVVDRDPNWIRICNFVDPDSHIFLKLQYCGSGSAWIRIFCLDTDPGLLFRIQQNMTEQCYLFEFWTFTVGL